jgi:hypothetical protein
MTEWINYKYDRMIFFREKYTLEKFERLAKKKDAA